MATKKSVFETKLARTNNKIKAERAKRIARGASASQDRLIIRRIVSILN